MFPTPKITKSSNDLLGKKSSKSKFHVSNNKASFKDDTQATRKEDDILSDLEKEYENIIYLFSLSLFKMMRCEYDIYKDTNKLLLYFAIVYFAINQVNQMLGFKGKTCVNSLFECSETYNLKTNNVVEFASVVNSVYEKNNSKHNYLKELELSNFVNEL